MNTRVGKNQVQPALLDGPARKILGHLIPSGDSGDLDEGSGEGSRVMAHCSAQKKGDIAMRFAPPKQQICFFCSPKLSASLSNLMVSA